MGHSAARGWFLVDLFRVLEALAEARARTTGFRRRDFFAQAAAFQTDGDVRHGEAVERRRLLVEFERARLSLLVATIADKLWLVD